MTPKDPGLFIVSVSADTEKLDKALGTTIAEIKRITTEKADNDEIGRAKLSIESSTIYSSETVNGMAQNIGSNITLTGDINFEKKYMKKIREITDDDILRVAKGYLNNGNLSSYIIVPDDLEKKPDKKWFEDILKNAEKYTPGKKETAKTDDENIKALSKTANKCNQQTSSGKVVKKILPGGTILLLEEDHEIPIVALQATLRGGLSGESAGKEGVMNFTFDMLPLGAGGMSSIEIAEKVDGIAGYLSTFSGRDLSGLSMNFLSQYLPEGLDIFFTVLKQPDFNDDDIEIKRNEILSKIKNIEDELTHFIFKLFTHELFGGHPYQNDILGSQKSIKTITKSDLQKYYSQTVRPDNLILSVTGDFESNALIKNIENELQDWSSGKSNKNTEPEPPSPISGIKTKTFNKDRQQAHIILGFRAPTVLDKDSYPLEVLDAILSGQGGKLFIELRDKQSLAYSVTSFFRPLQKSGIFGVYIATKPENRDKAVNGIINELNNVLEGGISEEDIDRAKKSLIGHFEIGLQRRRARASIVGTDEALGLGYENYLKYAKNIGKVSKKDIISTAKKYIDLNKYILTIIEPGEKNKEADSR